MESRTGNLISIIDTATLATIAFTKGSELLLQAMKKAPAGSEFQLICLEVIAINTEASEAVAFERSIAERQFVGAS